MTKSNLIIIKIQIIFDNKALILKKSKSLIVLNQTRICMKLAATALRNHNRTVFEEMTSSLDSFNIAYREKDSITIHTKYMKSKYFQTLIKKI